MAAEDGWVEIKHEETGMTSTVHTSSVPAWETAGWTRTDNGSEESGQQALPQLPPQEDLLDQMLPGSEPSDVDEE